jgi:RNA polymerase primary sigma factor
MDLISYGNMGLMQAVDKFDPELGYRFTTCATPWIKQAITKAIIDSGKSIRVPAHIYQLLAKYRKAVEELTKDGKGQPTQEQIAMYMGVSNDKIRELEEWRHDTVSLSTPLGDDSEDTLEDLQADNYSETPMKYVERKAKEEMIQALIATLKPRTQTIIKMRFGLGNDNDPEEFKKEHTLEEIGAYLGITRERVRQIEKQTLAELKLKWDGSY